MNKKRIADYGIQIGCMKKGGLNKITDVPGVRVGHATLCDEHHHTGVTVILPCEDNMFAQKLTAYSMDSEKRRDWFKLMSWGRWKRRLR